MSCNMLRSYNILRLHIYHVIYCVAIYIASHTLDVLQIFFESVLFSCVDT
ncbi:hypothetical protein NIES3974_18170 [Calothrix sp. NIES-3974]|nr:hypothetical protein NIES3974_18170 [Calothrix sp. NIES-3974]